MTKTQLVRFVATLTVLALLGAACAESSETGAATDGEPTATAPPSDPGDDASDAEDITGPEAETPSDAAVAADDAGLTATGSLRSDNTLIVDLTVTAPTGTALIIEVSSPGTVTRQVESNPSRSEHSVAIVGLRPETEYEFVARSASGEMAASPVTVTTGVLPSEAPVVEIRQSASSSADGITFFGVATAPGEQASGPDFYGVDNEGFVVWYLDSPKQATRDPVIRSLGNDEVLVFLGDGVDRLTLDGTEIASFDLSGVGGWHHDAVLLPNGNMLALSSEDRDVDGVEVHGDVIVEVSPDGSTVWQWSAFDHLDTTRFPGQLANREARSGGLDWTHANSVFFDSDTNEILMSLRSQNWVISIDRATGDVRWVAGESTDTDDSLGLPFLTLTDGSWTSGQHAATYTQDGELLIYDNGNETGGASTSSRAVVYAIDEQSLTASQVFDAAAPKYTASLGDIDELINGNLFLTSGGPGSSDVAHLVEVTRSGDTVWEATTDERIYRSERISWAEIDGGSSSAATPPARDPEPEDRAEPDEAAAASARGTIDLTGAVLVSTDANCASYVGDYTSMVTDVQTGTEFEGALTISAASTTCTLTSNQIPNHDMAIGVDFPNQVGEVDAVFEIPAEPRANASATDLGFTVHAVMLNGVIWEAYPAACFDVGPNDTGREAIGCGGNTLDNPWRYNVGSPLNAFRLDEFSAHAQATGLYHYHSTPHALHEADCAGVAASPVVGFARDGFPIYGPCFVDVTGTVRAAESSYVLGTGERTDVAGFTTPYVVGNVTSAEYNGQFIGDYEYVETAGDLDECNGMVVDGQYGYYVTTEYPYVLACFTGTPSTTFGPS